jgi:hypothetical protein
MAFLEKLRALLLFLAMENDNGDARALRENNLGRLSSNRLAKPEHMQLRKPISYLQSTKRHLIQNKTLRFLFFKESAPKHRVMQDINPVLLAFLSVGCFLAGMAGFEILASYGFVGFIFYYVGVLMVLLESLHCVFDR